MAESFIRMGKTGMNVGKPDNKRIAYNRQAYRVVSRRPILTYCLWSGICCRPVLAWVPLMWPVASNFSFTALERATEVGKVRSVCEVVIGPFYKGSL